MNKTVTYKSISLLFVSLTLALSSEAGTKIAIDHNPFKEGIVQPNYLTIVVSNNDGVITYKVNKRSMAIERVDDVLKRLAEFDTIQTIVVELQGEATPSDLSELTPLILNHGFSNVARRDDRAEPIWIHDDSWMEQ